MKPSIIIICLFVASFANSQTVINSTGGFIANGTNSLSYSLGEIAISTITSPQNFLTQGLLQPTNISTTIVENNLPKNNPSIKLFPNPVETVLHIVSDIDISYIQFYSIEGKLISQKNLSTKSIDISNLKQGVYFAKTYSTEKKLINTVKIIKN